MALEDEMLADAISVGQKRNGPVGWLDRLSPEHRDSVEAARRQWLAMGGVSSGVPAVSLANVICDRMTKLGYQMPRSKEVSNWLAKR